MIQSVRGLVSLAALLWLISLAACAPIIPATAGPAASPTTPLPKSTAGIPETGTELTNTEWELVSFNETGTATLVSAGARIILVFRENGRVTGNGGCNYYDGQFDLQGSTISFREITITSMYCKTQGILEQEQKYFEALQSVNRIEHSGNSLKVWYGDGQNFLQYASTPYGPPFKPEPSPTSYP